jgi:hypothetical protein
MKLNVLNLSACGLLSVMLACSLFAALATAQILTAPAAGLDPSKLPDVVGIHLGMPVEQALAVMKSLFPDSTYLQSVTAGKYMQT